MKQNVKGERCREEGAGSEDMHGEGEGWAREELWIGLKVQQLKAGWGEEGWVESKGLIYDTDMFNLATETHTVAVVHDNVHPCKTADLNSLQRK